MTNWSQTLNSGKSEAGHPRAVPVFILCLSPGDGRPLVNVQMELSVPKASLRFFLRRYYGTFSSFDNESFGFATTPVFLPLDPQPIPLGSLQFPLVASFCEPSFPNLLFTGSVWSRADGAPLSLCCLLLLCLLLLSLSRLIQTQRPA